MSRVVVTSLVASFFSVCTPVWAQEIPAEYQQVLTTLGKQGDYKANVLKVNIPRNDLAVTVAKVKTPTSFGFGGWVAMTKGTSMDVLMGDLVLTQEEVNPVMSALLENGLEVTAFRWDERERRHRRRRGDACRRSDASAEGPPDERTGRRGDPSPHDRHPADTLLPA